jgi:hypothetical protein
VNPIAITRATDAAGSASDRVIAFVVERAKAGESFGDVQLTWSVVARQRLARRRPAPGRDAGRNQRRL